MFNIIESSGSPIKAWTNGIPVEDRALEQVKNLASMGFITNHVAIMPDVHWGMGATIGSVIPTNKAIIPAAVGVDIGCGMMAVKTSITASQLPDSLAEIRSSIEKSVPHGRTSAGRRYNPKNDRGLWYNTPKINEERFKDLNTDLQSILDMLGKAQWIRRASENAVNQLGTLGTGNHFIELCLDENDDLWIMLHSGSRGIGNTIGDYFIKKAKEDMQRWLINLPDADLAYIPEGSENFDKYVKAVEWAQRFAKANREIMMQSVINCLSEYFPLDISIEKEAVNCHHNYISRENHFGKNVWITRKGAVRAREGELGIIPGSMGAKSFIVKGKGNPESFCSCSHGAGRIMSRMKAKKTISLDEHIKDTEGVECRKDSDVIDETPKAYKDIDAVIAAQSDLIDVVHTLKQVVCVKG